MESDLNGLHDPNAWQSEHRGSRNDGKSNFGGGATNGNVGGGRADEGTLVHPLRGDLTIFAAGQPTHADAINERWCVPFALKPFGQPTCL